MIQLPKLCALLLSLTFCHAAMAASDSSNKGTLNAKASFDWGTRSAAIRTSWSMNTTDYLWSINNDAKRYKLCWRKTTQLGDACHYNKDFFSESVRGATLLQNIEFDTNYHVKLEAYGKKLGKFPASFNRWRVVGKVNVKTNKFMRCDASIQWWDSSVNPYYDGANCFVYKVPYGYEPFVYANNYYVKASSPGNCSIGTWDTANCFLGKAPSGTKAFLYKHNFYYAEQ